MKILHFLWKSDVNSPVGIQAIGVVLLLVNGTNWSHFVLGVNSAMFT